MVGASAALSISRIPFEGPIGAVRVGRINGEFVLNPTLTEVTEDGDLDLIVAGTREGIIMMESGAKEVPEEMMLDAIAFAQAGHSADDRPAGRTGRARSNRRR